MKRMSLLKAAWFVAVIVIAVPAVCPAQDLREAYRKAEQMKEEQRRKALEKETAIKADRDSFTAAVIALEQKQKDLEDRLAAMNSRIEQKTARREELQQQWTRQELDTKEISGNVRVAARDVETILLDSPFTAFAPGRAERVGQLLDQGYFPDINDISGMAASLFEEIRLSGQVRMQESGIIGRDGEKETALVLTLGKFTTAYQTPQETGFLRYMPEGKELVALSTLPRGGWGRDLKAYFAGRTARVPLDMSGGNALAQVTQQTSFREQLEAGGPIVWPILGLAVIALVIVISRVVFLQRVHANTDRFMGEVNGMVARGDWVGAEDYVARNGRSGSPVIAIIKAGLGVRDRDRETVENVLQESILHQLPRVERGLSALAVLGAVAPLLGLLGTVTGMINTFRVITLFGTGDPKLMSGGISEALVTTELGLAVAIPIMLLHTYLSRRSDAIIGQMEEKAVQMANLIQLHRNPEMELAAREARGG